MAILGSSEGPGFLPTTKHEVDVAFLRWWHSEKGGEPLDTTLEKIFYSQMDLPHGQPEKAIKRMVGVRAAYARQALHDHRILFQLAHDQQTHPMRRPVPEDAGQTGIEYFGGFPAHIPGQLVRYIDLKRVANGATLDDFPFNPLGGDVKESRIAGGFGVVDPYTIAEPHWSVVHHIGKVLEDLPATDIFPLIEEADTNQEARLKFWGDVMVEAERESLARPIARSVLTAPGMELFYPEYSQPDVL